MRQSYSNIPDAFDPKRAAAIHKAANALAAESTQKKQRKQANAKTAPLRYNRATDSFSDAKPKKVDPIITPVGDWAVKNISKQIGSDAENIGTAAEGVSRGLNAASKQLRGMGLEKASKKVMGVADKAYSAGDLYQKEYGKYDKAERKGLGKFGNAAVDVTDMLGDVGGDVAASALAPWLGTARMASRSAGQAGYEARKKGNASYAGRAVYSAAMGGIGIGMSKIGNVSKMLKGAYGKGALDALGVSGVVDDAVNDLVKSATGRAAIKAAGAAGTQALYTNIQDRLTPVLERKTGVDENAKYDRRAAAKNAVLSGIMGFLTATPEIVHGASADIAAKRESAAVESADDAANSVYSGYRESGVFGTKPDSTEAHAKYRALGADDGKILMNDPFLAAIHGRKAAAERELPQTENDAAAENAAQNAAENATENALYRGERVDTSKMDADTFDRVAETGAAMDAEGKAYIPKPEEHIDARTIEGVGNRGVNAFQFDHPELHRYYQQAAEDLMSDADISNSLPNNAQKSRTLNGNEWDHSAMTSPALRDAMDETGLSRADIIDAAQRLVNDHGQENVAAAKRLEIVLDDMLTHGYETMDGRAVEPNTAYQNAKKSIPGYVEAESGGHGLDDVDADIAKGQLNDAPKGGTVNPTEARVQKAVALKSNGAGANQIFNETGLLQTNDGRWHDGVGGPVVEDAENDTGSTVRGNESGEGVGREEFSENGRGTDAPRYGNLEHGKDWENIGEPARQGIVNRVSEIVNQPGNTQNEVIQMLRNDFESDSQFAKFIVDGLSGKSGVNVDAVLSDMEDGIKLREDIIKIANGGNPDMGAANAGQFGKFGQMQGETGSYHDINPEAARNTADIRGRAPEEVPKVNPYSEENISKTVSTILNAPATSNEFASVLENSVADGAFDYLPVTDKQAADLASGHLEHSDYKSMAHEFIGKEKGGLRIGKNDFADAVAAYNAAVGAGDSATALELSTSMINAAHTSAQVTQAVNLVNRTTPTGKLYALQQGVDRMNDQYAKYFGKEKMPFPRAEKEPIAREDVSLVDVAEDNTGISIDRDLAARYLSAQSDTERADAWDAITSDLASKIPNTVKDKWNAWRYTAMLTNPTTHVRNMGGNLIMYLARETKNTLGTGMEKVFVRNTEERTKSILNPLSEGDKALKQFAAEQYKADKESAMGQGKFSDSSDMRSDIMREIQSKRKVFGEHSPVQWVSDKNSALLDLEDVLWNKPAYTQSFAEALKAKGVTAEEAAGGAKPELVQAAREYAISEAQKATFRDSNDFSDWVSSFGNYKGDNVVKRGASVVADAILPFRRTPANILVRGAVDYSPVGIARALGDVIKGSSTAAEAVDHLATGLTGTGIMGLGAYLAHEGVLTYRQGGDDDRKNKFLRDSGAQDFSLNIGGKSYTLDWMAPAAMPLFAGAAIAQAQEQNGGTTLENALNGIGLAGDTILNTSMLSSLNNAISNVSYSPNPVWFMVASTVSSYLSQAVPTVGGKIASTADPIVRSSYVQPGQNQVKQEGDYFLQSVLKRIPGARNTLQPAIDLWGNEKSNGSTAGRIAQNFLSPGYYSEMRNDPVDREITRLSDALGDHTMLPAQADRYIMADGKKVNLTGEQYTKYAQTMGKARHDILAKIISNRSYKGMTDAEKKYLVQNAYEYATAKAKSTVTNYQMEKWMQKADESGVGVPTYILYKQLLAKEKNSGKHMKEANAAVRQVILKDSSLSAQQKNRLDDLLINDLTIIPRDVKVDYSSPETFKVSQMSDGAQRHYESVKSRYGLTADQFNAAWNIYHDNSLHADQKRAKIAQATGKNGYALYKAFGKRTSGGTSKSSGTTQNTAQLDAVTKILLGLK